MKQTENYRINAHDVDFNGLLTPTGYMKYLQDCAYCQMETDGPSYDELFSRGLAFIISRIRILFFEPVRAHENVTVTTWSGGGHAASFFRCYGMEKDGREIARGRSVWALYDFKNKKLVRYADAEINYAIDEDPGIEITKRPEITGIPELLGVKEVFYTDVDQNRHMNNTRYADMFWNFLPGHEDKRISSIDISYLNEAPLGDEIEVYGGAGTEDGEYVFRTQRRSDGKVNALASVTFTHI